MRLFEFDSSSKKVILTDVDGVLLDHMTGFLDYMHSKGYKTQPGMENEFMFTPRFGIPNDTTVKEVTAFNDSERMKSLPPLSGAVEGVKKLAAAGYIFHAITAVSGKKEICEYRVENLQNLFGKDVFPPERVTCIPIGTSKTSELSKFADTGYYWVEDSTRHAKEGLAQGLDCLLISSQFNYDFNEEGITKVAGWGDIHTYVTEKEQTSKDELDDLEVEPELEPTLEPEIDKGNDDVNQTDQIGSHTGDEEQRQHS